MQVSQSWFVFLLCKQNKNWFLFLQTGPPVDVGIAVYIISISSVSEVQMDFTADIYFR